MSRENRFLGNSTSTSSHRRLSAKKVKDIYVYDIENEEDIRPLKIGMNKNVKDLKKEIEKLFNLSYSLNDHQIKFKNNGWTDFKLIHQEDESKTLFDNLLTSDSLVVFGKDLNIGGAQNLILNNTL